VSEIGTAQNLCGRFWRGTERGLCGITLSRSPVRALWLKSLSTGANRLSKISTGALFGTAWTGGIDELPQDLVVRTESAW